MHQRDDTLIIERSGGIVTVTFNKPERKNAIDSRMLGRLLEMLNEVRRRPGDRVLVVTGAQGDFSSGADVVDPSGLAGLAVKAKGSPGSVSQVFTSRGSAGEPEPEPEPEPEAMPHALHGLRQLGEAVLALHRLPIPTIAKVDGVAAGAGLSVALCCDLVVASERARFIEIFPKRGLSTDGGSSWLLPRLVGIQKAKELTFFGDVVSADQASAIGLVNRVVSAEELDDAVAEWARRLASGPTLALSMTKSLLNSAFSFSFEEMVEHEVRAQAINFASHDTVEAIAAFIDRREPHFTGN